jgi:hypothetical protein
MDLGIHPATPNKVDNYQQQKYTSMLLDAFACLLYCLSAFLQAHFSCYHLMEFASGIEKVCEFPLPLNL